MIKYAETLNAAKEIARQMKKDEPDYAEDTVILETIHIEYVDFNGPDHPGIQLVKNKNNKYVIHNETD